jgi:hypothetical protein
MPVNRTTSIAIAVENSIYDTHEISKIEVKGY